MKGLYELLEEVEERVDEFYKDAIELHNNSKLRSLAGVPLSIVRPQYGNKLSYGQHGFYTVVPKCIERGNAWENGVYEHPSYNFNEQDGKLVAETHEGLQEMLHLFPELTLNTLEDKLAQGIKESNLYVGGE